jgi:hypothetical protein
MERYGIDVRVEVPGNGFLASAVIAATDTSRTPPMYAYFDVCEADPPHTNLWRSVLTTRQTTEIRDSAFRFASHSVAGSATVPNLFETGAVFLCPSPKDETGNPLARVGLTVIAGQSATVVLGNP